MANENELIASGAILALIGFLLIVSAPLDNVVMGLIKITPDKLLFISITFLFGGIALVVVAARSRKKTR